MKFARSMGSRLMHKKLI